MTDSDFKKIKDLVAAAETETALEILSNLLSKNMADKAFLGECYKIQAQYANLRNEMIRGTMNTSEIRQEKAKINNSIIEFLKQIERGEKPNAPQKQYGLVDRLLDWIFQPSKDGDTFWIWTALFAVLFLGIIAFCAPGILFTSVIQYFTYSTGGHCWAISFSVGFGLLWFFWKKNENWRKVLKRLLVVCSSCLAFIFFLILIFDYSMPVRVLYRMFGKEHKVPFEHRTSSPEKEYLGMALTPTNEKILGLWVSTHSNLIFKKSGDLEINWHKEGVRSDLGKWSLQKGVLSFNIDSYNYKILEFYAREFSYECIETREYFLAHR